MIIDSKHAGKQQLEDAVASILAAIGEDPQREGLRETPHRVAEMYGEILGDIGLNPEAAIDAVFETENQDPVVLKGLPFFSMCEHHMLPFFGVARLGYVPDGRIAGLSKLARALASASRRLQVQERLTGQVADAIFRTLHPRGTVVELEAEHLCMSMRGIEKPGNRVVTTAVRGAFDGCAVDAQGLLSIMRAS